MKLFLSLMFVVLAAGNSQAAEVTDSSKLQYCVGLAGLDGYAIYFSHNNSKELESIVTGNEATIVSLTDFVTKTVGDVAFRGSYEKAAEKFAELDKLGPVGKSSIKTTWSNLEGNGVHVSLDGKSVQQAVYVDDKNFCTLVY